MTFRLISVVVTLAVIGVATAASLRSHLGSTTKNGAAPPVTLLSEAGTIVERTHQVTGTYTGVSLQGDSGLRLVSTDASGYCLQLTWVGGQLYHLRGPGGQPASGAC